MNRVDTRLYALIDPAQAGGHDFVALARAVVTGGATLVQLRDKASSTRDMIVHVARLKKALAGTGVPLVVNDRMDVVLASGADGVHLGQDDMPVEQARTLLGPGAIIGASAGTHEEVAAVPLEQVDYVCIGGVFATSSKGDAGAPIGLDGFGKLAGMIRAKNAGLNVCAIAGITEKNAADVIAAGSDGIAVISALANAEKPEGAARALRAAVDAALEAKEQA